MSPRLPGAPGELATVEATEQAAASRYAAAVYAPSTLRAYASDLRTFGDWCEARGLPSVPCTPRNLCRYLGARAAAGAKPGPLSRALGAIGRAHVAHGLPSPALAPSVRETMAGIRRIEGRPARTKAPADARAMLAMLAATTGDTLEDVRDRAVLLVGFCAALRRSELAALQVGDVAFEPEGVLLTLRRSKTDPDGKGRTIGLPFSAHVERCPVRALRAWLAASGCQVRHEPGDGAPCDPPRIGALFFALDKPGRTCLGGRSIALLVKAAARRAGLDPARYGGHSLRRGFATEAGRQDVPERRIARQTGHRSLVVLRGYIDEGSIWRDNAAAGLLDREGSP